MDAFKYVLRYKNMHENDKYQIIILVTSGKVGKKENLIWGKGT